MSYLITLSVRARGRHCAPEPESLRRASDLFERFHCYSSDRVLRTHCSRTIPELLVHVGELRGLIYRSDRGQRGQPRTFVHFLETPARLACDVPGRQLYILGGYYRVTPRGIEG